MSTLIRNIARESFFPERLSIRKPATIRHYEFAFNDFDRFLGRKGCIDDLNDSTVSRFKRWMLVEKKLAAKTTNERAGRIITLWSWLAKKRIVDAFPTVQKIPEPRRVPVAWTIEQIKMIHENCRKCRGYQHGVPAGFRLQCLIAFLWNTAERIGAAVQIEWNMLDTTRGTILLPAEIRKRGQADAVYVLWPEVLGMLERIREFQEPGEKRIFADSRVVSSLYHQFGKVLSRAGLPQGRNRKFHCFRVSHATWIKSIGGDATAALGHANPETTKKHYIDPTIIKMPPPALEHSWLGEQ